MLKPTSTGRLGALFLAHAALFALAPAALPAVRRQPVTAAERVPFPLVPVAAHGSRGLELELVPERFLALAGRRALVMDQVPLPGRGEAALVLRRIEVARPGAVLAVDGAERPLSSVAEQVLLFSGRLAGEDDSFAFLALSPFGSRGFIRSGAEFFHLDAAGTTATGSAAPASSLARLSPAAAPAMVQAACGALEVAQPFWSPQAPSGFAPPPPGIGLSGATVYLAEIAVETDWQYYQLFGDVDAASAYALTLFGAASAIYEEQCGTVFSIPYLGIHSSSNDGWTAPDGGNNTVGLLYEFRGAWAGGNGPVTANLYHFLSGAALGGGVAYLDVLCNQYYGFGVSANINGGLTVPITGPAPWDLVVVAHELGHNFSTPHTHDYCPPIDECASASYYGPCQDERICISNGTIMSYCHLCAGGLSNIQLEFHSRVVVEIRAAVEASCLEPAPPSDTFCIDPAAGVHRVIDPAAALTASATAALEACGAGEEAVQWSAALLSAAPWLVVAPLSGTLDGAAAEIALDYDASGLEPGFYDVTVRFSNDAEPGDSVDLVVTLLVKAPPFVAGDQLIGALDDGTDVDRASADGLAGEKLKLTVDHATGAAPVTVTVQDEEGGEVLAFTVAPGKKVRKKAPFGANSTYMVEVSGGAATDFAIATKAKLPATAQPFKATLKAAPATGFGEVTFKALAGATLAFTVKPKGGLVGPFTVALYDPDGDPVSLAGSLAPDGLAAAGLALDATGTYRIRVSGFPAAGGKAKVVVTPVQPAGIDTVEID